MWVVFGRRSGDTNVSDLGGDLNEDAKTAANVYPETRVDGILLEDVGTIRRVLCGKGTSFEVAEGDVDELWRSAGSPAYTVASDAQVTEYRRWRCCDSHSTATKYQTQFEQASLDGRFLSHHDIIAYSKTHEDGQE